VSTCTLELDIVYDVDEDPLDAAGKFIFGIPGVMAQIGRDLGDNGWPVVRFTGTEADLLAVIDRYVDNADGDANDDRRTFAGQITEISE
jgi:hypothetical protein